MQLSQGTLQKMKGALKRACGHLEAFFLVTQVGDTQVPWATLCLGGSSDLKVAIRSQSWEALMSPLPPAGVVQLSPGGEPKAAHGGREGSSCWQWAWGQAWEHQAEESRGGLTGGALCPGCPHPEGWPSRSLLNPALSHPAALGCLPVTQSSRISLESPSSPTPAATAQWAPLWSPDSLGPLRLGHSW